MADKTIKNPLRKRILRDIRKEKENTYPSFVSDIYDCNRQFGCWLLP